MRSIIFAGVIVIIYSFTCQNIREAKLPSGIYKGTFQRLHGDDGAVSDVSFRISDSDWNGQSQTSNYPALCEGTYQIISHDSIRFSNNCMFTADFDWTLILTGDYQWKLSGKTLRLTRKTQAYTDVYNLVLE